MELFKVDLGWTKANYKNIAWHASVLGIAAVLTYLLEQLPNADFGDSTPFITLVVSSILKTALEFVKKG